ncbi:MAG: adenylate/guanylate cyclase domain-containing protein [Flavobacteriales bacterium]|nr:adenylate/guanylate cyclase domain-containing protein [Flavobacteriales bacterium]
MNTHKILVVDDEPDVEILITQRFRNYIKDGRFSFVFAFSGLQAIEVLQKDEDICMLLTDINMPGMDGLTLLHKVSEMHRTLKSLVISAYGDMKNIRSAMNEGAFDFITKPMDMSDLEATLLKTIREVEYMQSSLLAHKELESERAEKLKVQEQNLAQAEELARMVSEQNITLEKKVVERTQELQEKSDLLNKEKERAEKLLLNVLPAEVAAELKLRGKVKPRLHENVTIIFIDIYGFTRIAASVSPEDLIEELDYYYKVFDTIFSKHKIEKIKTIGDAYLAVSGLPQANASHAVNALKAVQEILGYVEMEASHRSNIGRPYFEVRAGIHSGQVIAGVVGHTKFAYDVWGDDVNIASRVETCGAVMRINISQSTYELVKEISGINLEHRGKIEAKNKGEMDMYFASLAP